MAIELITGRAGAPHVDSADVGAFNAAMFGGGAYVIEGVEATLQDANHVVISAGEMLCEGRHIRITGAGETLTIDNGLSGYKRNDIVAMHYERDSSDIETCSLVVIKGNQATETQQDPPMPTSGKLLEGAASVYWPLYRIVVDGLTPQDPAFIAQRQALYKLGQGTEIPANSDLNNYIRPGKYWINFDNVVTIANIPTNISTSCIMYVDTVKEGYLQQRYVLGVASHGVTVVGMGGLEYTRRYVADQGFTDWICTSGVDSIVAEGSNGLTMSASIAGAGRWNWEKYASGRCHLAVSNSTNTATYTASGGLYVSQTYTAQFPFPVNVSSITSSHDSNTIGISISNYAGAQATSFDFKFHRGIANQPWAGFSFDVWGFWK